MELNVKIPCDKDNYNVYFESDLSRLKELLLSINASKVMLITDTNVSMHWEKKVLLNIPESMKAFTFKFEAGEASKNLDTVNLIYEALTENKFNRTDLIIALGGGVVGDTAAYVAHTFKRGLPFIALPTSLLSMVDSSVGGKSGVDYKSIKNMVGAFSFPEFVYINTEFLSTLPEREFYNGFAEIMKHGLIKDEEYYLWLIDNMYEICEKDPDTLLKMISHSVEIKKSVVENDPYERGERALLNFGHTIGHAIEAYFKGEYIHGEAVALGCVAASYISWKRNMLEMEDYYEIRDMFVPFNLPITIKTDDLNEIIELMKFDKKNTGNEINMVLLNKIGEAVLVNNIGRDEILKALEELNFKDEV